MEKRKDYRMIVYDGFFQDYIWETEYLYDTEDDVIENAKEMYSYIDQYSDEVQLYVRGLGMGEWCMFGYIEKDENNNLYVEPCFC